MASCFRFTRLEDSLDSYNYIRGCIKVISLLVLLVLVFSISGYGEYYSFEDSVDLRGWEYYGGDRWMRDLCEGYNESCCSFRSGEMLGSIGVTSVCRNVTVTEPTE
ncbi:MAG: hypothetical protein U9N48_06765, partial [Euryarchaeota archaeon]|nr:hypothetical protein [Euryarchaeota archaeon]